MKSNPVLLTLPHVMTSPRPAIVYFEHPDFRSSLSTLYKKGGRFQKAAKAIHALLDMARDPGADPFHGVRGTKNGESRIDNAFKYDFNNASRLITIQTNGCCVFLFAGDHGAADTWLESNRGLVPVLDKNNRGVMTYRSSSTESTGRIATHDGHFVGPLYTRLPDDDFEALVRDLPRGTVRALERVHAEASEAQLWETVAPIEDSDRRTLVYDVFAMLKANRLSPAIARIRQYTGEMTPLAAAPATVVPEIVDSQVLRRIDPRDPAYAIALERFMKSARYRDWMTFLHPDQEEIVNHDFAGPAKLVGVSGSGKTCVVVRRAVRMAQRHRDEPILIVTLNRSLATLIDELVTVCAGDEERKRIEVLPFFDLCRQVLLGISPNRAKVLDERTWKTHEHVDEVWTEFYRCENNNHDARRFQDVHDTLLARGWDPERYLREEFDWVRSALAPRARSAYEEESYPRKGRTLPLTQQYRGQVLEGLEKWEEKMEVVGLIDSLGIAQELSKHLARVSPRYRCILVDEVQDFGNVELEIIRALVAPAENDLFLCGDAAQAVTTKYQSFKEAGISIAGTRSRRLQLNYRNSRDILEAAYQMLLQNLTDEFIDREDFEVLDPDFSALSGGLPLLLEGRSLAHELACAFELAKERQQEDESAKVCIAFCGYSLYELTPYGTELGLPVLDGTTSIDDGHLFLSDLEQTKGFEFDMMIVVNCSEGTIPDRYAPAEELHRDLARLYVAMTRARTDLVVSHTGEPSIFIKRDHKSFLCASWSEYVDDSKCPPVAHVPRSLDAIRDNSIRTPWRDMTGEQFLRTPDARGASLNLIAKIRALIDGRGLMKGGQPVKFRTMGAAARAFQNVRSSQNLWGPTVGAEFETLVHSLEMREREVRAGRGTPTGVPAQRHSDAV